jgi:mannitol-1-/sugar-/sorbitol-6-phosphatase
MVGSAGLCLDLDGVLVDSYRDERAAWSAFADRHRLQLSTILDPPGGSAAQRIRRAGITGDALDAEVQWLHAWEVKHARCDALPGAAVLLASPLPTAIVTNTGRAVAVARLKSARLPTPGVVVSADDVTNPKPDPEPYVTAAERLGLDPGECLAIEDTDQGAQSARAAGLFVVALGPHPVPSAHLTLPHLA